MFDDFLLFLIVLKKVQASLDARICYELVILVLYLQDSVYICILWKCNVIFQLEFVKWIEISVSEREHLGQKRCEFFGERLEAGTVKEFTLVPSIAKYVEQDRL